MHMRTVEQVAHDLLEITRRHDFDPTDARDEITATVQPFVTSADELAELFEHGGIETAMGASTSRLIYYSPELLFMLSKFETDFVLPVHNHEMWNFLFICRGEMHFRWYRRLDDRSIENEAHLEIADDRKVRAGEVGFIAPPPNDIHQLSISEPGTWMVTVTPRPEPIVREIYNPTAGTYIIKALAVTDEPMV